MDVLSNLALDLDLTPTPINIVIWLLGCASAILIGAFLAKKQARVYSGQKHGAADDMASSQGDLPAVNFFDYGDMRFLHLGTPKVQGSMKISKPYDIHLEYVQRMMSWLLFADLEQVSQLQAMQLGLGAAALTKFCHKHLDIQTTAVELNPNVISACRLWFNLPEDNAKLQVVLGDAAEVICQEHWLGKVDALQVDLSDKDAISPSLDSEAFYADCRKLLTKNGCMTVNLFGYSSNFKNSLQKISKVFGTDALWVFKPTKSGNSILLAFKTPRALDRTTLQKQAQAIEAIWPLPATKWLKVLAPVNAVI